MKVSYNWLNKYFDGKLPPPDKIAEELTFHAWEIEEVEQVGSDTVLDIKVLPDKSMWALSHRGIAKDLSVILKLPMVADPLSEAVTAPQVDAEVGIKVDSATCRRFAAAKIEGVKVGPSPTWLKEALEALGQRSINNIVDASNYVMFDLGQPSHAFDAAKVGDRGFNVRNAKMGETLTGLDEIEYTFDEKDTVIARADNNEILSIAGLKGGMHSGISDDTTNIMVEVASWDPVAIRKTGQRLKLRTDASSRYENGIVPEMVPVGLNAVTSLIMDVAGGHITAYADTGYSIINDRIRSEVSLGKLNSVLGVSLTVSDVSTIIERFGWEYNVEGEIFTITSPFERTDLVIAEDLIEEIGRVYGYEHVPAITPEKIPLTEINHRFYYSEIIRDTLIPLGFSEIYTSSFRNQDKIKLANALASDKGYLRSNLIDNLDETLVKNAPNADLLGVSQIRIFELGNVFNETGEHRRLALGVRSPSGYKAKVDDPVITEAIKSLETALGLSVETSLMEGTVEIDLDAILEQLPPVTEYLSAKTAPTITYKPYSNYPSMSRDIAMWVGDNVSVEEIEELLNSKAGTLRARTTLFDQFKKDDKVSYAFRLVFQSHEKTLAGSEVDLIMDEIYQAVRERGWEVR